MPMPTKSNHLIPTNYVLPADCWFGCYVKGRLEFDENKPQKKGSKITFIREFDLKEEHILKHLPGKPQYRYLALDAACAKASRGLVELPFARNPGWKDLKRFTEIEYYGYGKVTGSLYRTFDYHQVWISNMSFKLIYLDFYLSLPE